MRFVGETAPIRDAEAGTAMTLEEWAGLPEEVAGEWVAGALMEEEVPGYVHELIVGWLLEVLRRWVVPLGGVVGASGAKFAVTRRRGRKPDVTVFLPGRPMPPRSGLVRVPPDIAVEVVSTDARDRRRDRIEKLAEYAEFGVPWYWIVDPDLQSLEIFELGADRRYAHAFSALGGTHDRVPGCAGLRLDLGALWAEVARLADEG